jgi:hypothetical protein
MKSWTRGNRIRTRVSLTPMLATHIPMLAMRTRANTTRGQLTPVGQTRENAMPGHMMRAWNLTMLAP